MNERAAKRLVKCKNCGLTINAEYPAAKAYLHEECPDVDPDLQEGWKRTLEIMRERMKEGKNDDTLSV